MSGLGFVGSHRVYTKFCIPYRLSRMVFLEGSGVPSNWFKIGMFLWWLREVRSILTKPLLNLQVQAPQFLKAFIRRLRLED